MTVSTGNRYSPDDEIHRTTFDPSAEDPCAAVVEAIDVATDAGQTPSVLANSIDPDTLVQLYRDDGSDSWMLSFDHDGLEVTLWAGGRIHVDASAVADSVESTETAEPVGSADQTT